MRAISAVVVAAALATACTDRASTAAPTPSGATAVAANATVVEIVDGDTIDVEVRGRRERVRLIGIDTPETRIPDQPPECYGPEASARTAELLPIGTPVRLERDTEPRDDYGRLLAYVHRAADALLVNVALVEEGFATPLTFEPNTAHRDRFVEAARAAESADRGLWGAC